MFDFNGCDYELFDVKDLIYVKLVDCEVVGIELFNCYDFMGLLFDCENVYCFC